MDRKFTQLGLPGAFPDPFFVHFLVPPPFSAFLGPPKPKTNNG
jgi:hypothetical protein